MKLLYLYDLKPRLNNSEFTFTDCEKAIRKSKIWKNLEPIEVSDHVKDQKNADELCIKPRKEFQKIINKVKNKLEKLDKSKEETKESQSPPKLKRKSKT